MVDAVDLKSTGYFYPCRFESGPRHQTRISYVVNETVDTSFVSSIEQPALF